jgi:flagella basal body P-ring formation protein FlgA
MSFFRATFITLLLCLPQIGQGQATNAPETNAWELVPEAQVDSAGLFLDQILLYRGTNWIVPHLCVAPAPHLGQTNAYSRSDIALLAQSARLGVAITRWAGSDTVHVSRRLKNLEDADLLDLLTATLQKEYVKNQGQLELHLARTNLKPLVPDEPLTLKVIDLPMLGLSPSFILTYEIWAGREHAGTWQAPLRASIWHDIPMARSPLPRGLPLKEADVMMERADLLVQRDAFLNFPTTDPTLELSENISVGHPILNRSVRARPLILRGQVVEGIFQEGALAISLMVETLEDGALGQTVRVRNPKTMRELFGKVENEKTIRITL